MRHSSYILLLLVLLVAGCTSQPASKPSSGQSGIVGTWRWIRVDDRAAPQRFHVRYYADGRAATWPAPAGWSTTTNGVSHGRYHLEGEFLVLETGRGKDDPKTRMTITGDEMLLIAGESNRLVYRRVVPDLEPGK
jgi:hypothetical protein